jgi:hypothetical protein
MPRHVVAVVAAVEGMAVAVEGMAVAVEDMVAAAIGAAAVP